MVISTPIQLIPLVELEKFPTIKKIISSSLIENIGRYLPS